MVGIVLLSAGLVGCGGGGDDAGELGTPEAIVVPHTVIEALDDYAFISDLEMSEQGEEVRVTFTGDFQTPDRYRGTLTVSGERYEDLFRRLNRPTDGELIAIGSTTWWRSSDGNWLGPIESTGDGGIDPFLIFAGYASPDFFVRGLNFDSLTLRTTGVESVSGTMAHHVRLSKEELIGMLDQGTFAKEEGKDPAIVLEDAMAFLPDDTVIEVWLAESDLHPIRILVTLSAAEGDSHAQDFFLRKPFDVRLQMDITDAAADVSIEPPAAATPVASPTP